MNYFKGIKYEDIRPIFERVWDQIQSFAPMDSEKEKASEKKGSRKKSLAMKRAEEFAMEIESVGTKYPIVNWKTHVMTENFMYYQIIRADGGSKNYKIFSEMLDILTDQHLISTKEEDEVWRHQHEYNLIKKKYPLTQEMLSKMLSRKLEVDHESTMAYELLRFIRSQETESPQHEECWCFYVEVMKDIKGEELVLLAMKLVLPALYKNESILLIGFETSILRLQALISTASFEYYYCQGEDCWVYRFDDYKTTCAYMKTNGTEGLNVTLWYSTYGRIKSWKISMKICIEKSKNIKDSFLSTLGYVLSNHRLTTPTRVRGNTRRRAESFVLNRLATSSTFLICSIAFSVELSEKVVLRNSLKSCPLISSVAFSGLLILSRVLLRIHKKYRCCGLEQAKCLFWPETVFQDWRIEYHP
ncbi:hypothetical protein Tco_0738829 [Tanacetum coccineum]